MTKQEFLLLVKIIKNQVIKPETLEIVVQNANGDLIDENTIIIDDTYAIVLAESLKSNPYVTNLILNYNNISNTGAIALAKVPTLKVLELYGNQIGLKGAIALAKTKLEKLVIGGNGLHLEQNDTDKIELIETLINNNSLRELDFECCLHSDQLIDKLIRENSTLININLSYNNLTDNALQSIHLNHSLKTLYLSNNYITDAGIHCISSNNSLENISLAENNITLEGAKELFGSHLNQFHIFSNNFLIQDIQKFNQEFEAAKLTGNIHLHTDE